MTRLAIYLSGSWIAGMAIMPERLRMEAHGRAAAIAPCGCFAVAPRAVNPRELRSANRYRNSTCIRNYNSGFRIARNLS